MKCNPEILKIIEAGIEGDKKKVFAYADLLWYKLDDSDSLKKGIENRLSGAYKTMPILKTMKSHYRNKLKGVGFDDKKRC